MICLHTAGSRRIRGDFLNHKIFLTKQHIVMAVVQYCADHNDDMPGLAKMLDNGAMSIVEFSDEIVMELIRHAYDVKMEKSSLRSHLMKNNMPEDSDKAAYSRIQKYAQKYRDREADRRLENGEPMDEESIKLLRGLSMDTIEEKTSGYQINDMQFFELTQLRDIRLLKSFVEHRLENSKKVSNTAFREMYAEYEKFIDDNLIPKDNATAEDIVFNTIAFWVLEWKYPMSTFYDIALLDEKDSLGEIDSRQVCAVCGDSIIPYTNGNIYTHSRFIKQRGALVPKIICNKEKMTLEQDFDNFTLGQYLIIKALMLNYYCADANSGLLLKDWFVQETTIDDWAEFLKDYDLFSVYKKKEWTDQRIKKVRDLIKQMTIK